MDIEHYVIRPFKVGRIGPGKAVLYGPAGIHALHSDAIAAALSAVRGMHESGDTRLTADALVRLLRESGVDPDAATRFLVEETRLLHAVRSAAEPDRSLVVATGDSNLDHAIRDALGADIEARIARHAAVHVAMLTDYSVDRMRDLIRSALSDEACVVFCGYVLGRTFVIDAPYSRSFATPCHFCHLRTIRRKARHLRKGWYDVACTLEDCDDSRLLSAELRPFEREACAFHLVTAVRQWFDGGAKDERLGYYTEIDLNTGAVRSDIAPHFQHCRCLSGIDDAAP